MNLKEMTVKQLRDLAKEFEIVGRWDMTKDQLIKAIERAQLIKEAKELGIEYEKYNNEELKRLIEEKKNNKNEERKRGRNKRKINVYKDGELIITIEGLLETFEWAAKNHICNQGWVKRSLRNGEPTKPGYRFKEGGYLFKYAD
jgi:hypothetical protein